MNNPDLTDELQTAFCQHFCQNSCKANEQNDVCFCTEAGIIAAEKVQGLLAQAGRQGAGAAAPPRFPCPPRLVVCR